MVTEVSEILTEYGRRWSPVLPRGQISFLIARLHVSLPDESVVDEITARVDSMDNPISRELRSEYEDYAVACHQANRELYNDVMRGTV